MSEMKSCHCGGIRQSPVEAKNAEYETLVRLVLESGDEKQLLTLIDIMRAKIITGVSSLNPHKLAYPDQDLWKIQIIAAAASTLGQKLLDRQ